jgi:hypothetical protein
MTIEHGSAGPLGMTFLVERPAEGGFIARALGESIFTEASSVHDLDAQIRDAVRCHFDESHAPTTIRLRLKPDDLIPRP